LAARDKRAYNPASLVPRRRLTANLRHIAFISPEPQKLYDYYHHLYGLEQVRVSPSGSIHVIDGLFNLAFLAQQAVEHATVDTHREDGHEIDQSTGIAHFGFTVDRLEDVFDKLGQEVHRGETPQNGRPAEMRVVDPFGNRVGISSRGFLGREERKTPAIRYASIECTDPDGACKFYRDNFDLTEIARTENSVLMSDGYITMEFTPNHTVKSPGIQYFGIQIDDWEDLRTKLAELGEELPEIVDDRVMLNDPEGNPYAVSTAGWA
jgi:catechol 2,3-dioxygenase-like lactoylglutathione lyase family enzyme